MNLSCRHEVEHQRESMDPGTVFDLMEMDIFKIPRHTCGQGKESIDDQQEWNMDQQEGEKRCPASAKSGLHAGFPRLEFGDL